MAWVNCLRPEGPNSFSPGQRPGTTSHRHPPPYNATRAARPPVTTPTPGASRMRLALPALALVPLLAMTTPADDKKPAADTRVFEMRTYYAAPGKLDALNARFRDHTTKLFEKHGMTNV